MNYLFAAVFLVFMVGPFCFITGFGGNMLPVLPIVKIAKPEPKYKWPDTEAPDKTQAYWELNNNLSVNGVPYKKVEVSPDKWQWQIDKVSQEAGWRYEQEKAELYQSLRTRILTDKEFERAKSLGLSLVTQNMVPYFEADKRRELDDAFLQQERLRAER